MLNPLLVTLILVIILRKKTSIVFSTHNSDIYYSALNKLNYANIIYSTDFFGAGNDCDTVRYNIFVKEEDLDKARQVLKDDRLLKSGFLF